MPSLKTLLPAALALSALTAQAEPVSYTIDPGHTFVTFEVLHFGTSTNRGRFDKKQGSVTLDRKARTGKIDITIETGSISTGVGPFEAHLKGPDFFDAEMYPTARFVSDQLRFDGDKLAEVSGTLTLLDKSQPVVLKASNFNCYINPRLQREVCGGDFETTIQRSRWGMNYGLPAIPDQVRLLIQVEGVKQQ